MKQESAIPPSVYDGRMRVPRGHGEQRGKQRDWSGGYCHGTDNSHASQGGEEDGFKVPSKSRTSNTEDDIDITQSCLQRDL